MLGDLRVDGLDLICVSPKAHPSVVVTGANELKLVFPQQDAMPEEFANLGFSQFFLQPMDGPERRSNTKLAIAYCKAHPQWRLSLQTQKILEIP